MRRVYPQTSFLFVEPSFLHGFARTLDIGATYTLYNISRTSEQADAEAIYRDWLAIGMDLQACILDELNRTEDEQ